MPATYSGSKKRALIFVLDRLVLFIYCLFMLGSSGPSMV